MTANLDAAADFVHSVARLLERHRFAHLFLGAGAAPVLDALRAYRNPDGGFGHALEPDLRAPTSQPVGVQTAMEIVHEARADDDPMIGPACDFLATIAQPDGGVPFALESAIRFPHAPWWRATRASSLTQTAANAAALHALGVSHPWLERAGEFCWARIDALDLTRASPEPGLAYDVRFAVAFLDAVPDAHRAESALHRLGRGLVSSGLVATDPAAEGDVQTPLDLSPWPGSRSRRLFDDALIERHLDALADAQGDDGGWSFGWPAWNDAATHEWRGIMTVRALRVLRENGRL